MSALLENTQALALDFQWLSEVIQARFTQYFNQEEHEINVADLLPPKPTTSAPYATFVRQMEERLQQGFEVEKGLSLSELKVAHRILLLLALAPHVKPATLDVFFARNKLYDRGFTEFGGVSSKQHGGFLPTGETVMFLLAGADVSRRIQFQFLFDDTYFLFLENVIALRSQQPNEPFLSGILTLSDEFLTRFTTGDEYHPRYGSKFPASRIKTEMEWKDMVLDKHLHADVLEVADWVTHEHTIMSEFGLGKFVKPGFRALFHGPPGTGKTLCATLLGKKTDRPVYRIDLSQVVSKYIGETEKNLAHLFDIAEHKNWILFFDEADALFGKRTTTKSGNDRYANQEVAYLLQRIEGYNGLVILASNLKGNIDEAFARRFQAMLYFPIPNVKQRLQLWQNTFGDKLSLANDVDLTQFANDFELSGGSIVNVVRYCALAVLRRNETVVNKHDIREGVRRELRKVGKTV